MADYKEISQTYAQGAIRAAVLLNSGAAIAILAQLSSLLPSMRGAVQTSMTLWVIGTAIGGASWVLGFLSTRYVDKWIDEKDDGHRKTSNHLMHAGTATVLVSFSLFLIGALWLACRISGAVPRV